MRYLHYCLSYHVISIIECNDGPLLLWKSHMGAAQDHHRQRNAPTAVVHMRKKKHSIPSDHIDWLRNSMLQITLWLYDIALDTMAHLDDLWFASSLRTISPRAHSVVPLLLGGSSHESSKKMSSIFGWSHFFFIVQNQWLRDNSYIYI